MRFTVNLIEPGSCEAPFPFDFDAAYRTDEYRGVGFWADGYEAETVHEWQFVGDEDDDRDDEDLWVWDEEGDTRPTGKIVAHMIGDDRRFTFEPDELIRVDGPVCSCGQLGCGWHGEEA